MIYRLLCLLGFHGTITWAGTVEHGIYTSYEPHCTRCGREVTR